MGLSSDACGGRDEPFVTVINSLKLILWHCLAQWFHLFCCQIGSSLFVWINVCANAVGSKMSAWYTGLLMAWSLKRVATFRLVILRVLPSNNRCMLSKHLVHYNTLRCTIGQCYISDGCGHKCNWPHLTTHTAQPSDKHFCWSVLVALFYKVCHVLVWRIWLSLKISEPNL